MEPQVVELSGRHLEHEVGWKTVAVSSDGTVERLCLHDVEVRQVDVEHHSMTADRQYRAFYSFLRNGRSFTRFSIHMITRKSALSSLRRKSLPVPIKIPNAAA